MTVYKTILACLSDLDSCSATLKLAFAVALVGMSVPAADFREGNLQADIGFDQLGDLFQVPAKSIPRIGGAIGGLVDAGADLLEHVEGVKRFLGRAVEDGIDR